MRPIVRSLFTALCLGAAATALADDTAKPADAATPEVPKVAYVNMTTSKGDILLELNGEKAPITVANFLAYVEDEHFNGLIFHRIMKDFMIQGGGFTPDMQQRATKKPIKLEADNGLTNARGTIAMARTGDPNSATSQFFINVVDNGFRLDPIPGRSQGYAVFGQVVAGMDVVDAIRDVPVGPDMRGEPSKPREVVTIETTVRLDEAEAKKIIEAEKAAQQKEEGTGAPAE